MIPGFAGGPRRRPIGWISDTGVCAIDHQPLSIRQFPLGGSDLPNASGSQFDLAQFAKAFALLPELSRYKIGLPIREVEGRRS